MRRPWSTEWGWRGLLIDETGDIGFVPEFNPAQAAHEKIGVKIGAANIAIGDGFQADVLLLGDQAADGGVFGFAQIVGGYTPGGVLADGAGGAMRAAAGCRRGQPETVGRVEQRPPFGYSPTSFQRGCPHPEDCCR